MPHGGRIGSHHFICPQRQQPTNNQWRTTATMTRYLPCITIMVLTNSYKGFNRIHRGLPRPVPGLVSDVHSDCRSSLVQTAYSALLHHKKSKNCLRHRVKVCTDVINRGPDLRPTKKYWSNSQTDILIQMQSHELQSILTLQWRDW